MIDQNALINKCNKMAMMIGMCHALLAQQYNEHPSIQLEECILNLKQFVMKEFYEDNND